MVATDYIAPVQAASGGEGRVRSGVLRASRLEAVFDPQNSLKVFSGALLLFYGLLPSLVYLAVVPDKNFLLLSAITCVGVASMWLGSRITLFDNRFRPGAVRLALESSHFLAATWLIFVVFVVVTFATAPSIPFLSALKGAGADALSQERGSFLKGRDGAEIALLYISTFLVNTVLPYSVIWMYANKSPWRHFAALAFFAFCISFLQKSLFLNLVLPMLAYLAAKRRLHGGLALLCMAGSVFLLIFATYLSLGGAAADDQERISEAVNYFSASYAPAETLDYFLWRAFAVPVFTATDTLAVYFQQFDGVPLLGSTSTLLAAIFGVEKVNIERFVFQYQFGSWNDIANANSVYVIDGFVNFGWGGVIVFGAVVGLVFRWFRLSRDVGFKSLWTLFAFVLFSAPLLGMMLSNGFLYMILHALFIRVRPREA